MKILVIGSTGPQGREFVAQALAAGHAVCAFARNPAALQPAPGLEVLRGDVFDQHSLHAAARGQDAAVSMLGVSLAAARRPTNVFSQGTRNLIAALKAAGVRRLIVQSSFGVGDSRHDSGWRCHVADSRARSGSVSGIVRPLRPRCATWSLRHREACGAFGLR